MFFKETSLSGLYIVELEPYTDERGLFARTFCKKEFGQIGHNKEFVQVNFSLTKSKGSIRGMHYQVPPFSEIKLIRCIRGAVFDVVIDIRKNSPTFLKYFSVELSEINMKMIYIPEGFAHGFQTLADNAQLIYHHTNYYAPGNEAAIKFNDPQVGIRWPLPVTTISEKDNNHKLLEKNFKGILI
ncbi:MAG: dTDP-4-dehydrorhamnose 3,5-epimerase [Bacteroidales bacterium]|nr:dTDP-4-dehydrorhamnose 3,5-epimerase [Bacteroidales bacterium]